MAEIVILTGHLATGKTALAQTLAEQHGFVLVRTSELLRERFGQQSSKPLSRTDLQDRGRQLDEETDGEWLSNHIEALLSDQRPKIVIDHVRNERQLRHFRNRAQWRIVHVHLYAPKDSLEERFGPKQEEENIPYAAADPIESEEDIAKFRHDADVRINVNRTDHADTYIRVAARLGLFSDPGDRLVDIIIGGQFGSEGKGHIAAALARNYDLVIRVGGPNAGHTVSSESGRYTYHQLPSGSKDMRAKILLGPGMTIDKAKLLQEIEECGVTPDRLCIDPQAMLIAPHDKQCESDMREQIASTASGSGAAAARRITSRLAEPAQLAGGDVDLKKYTVKRAAFAGDAVSELEWCYAHGLKVLLEGTQGSGLSIFHGRYPYVTSRDTNVAGCLTEAGISPRRVRRVVMVVRTTPIRVGNPDNQDFTSGPLKNEVGFDEIAKSAGLDADKVKEAEKTSTTKRNRRVGWFDWELFRKSCILNTPTDIALTFVDYLDGKNNEARRFEQLTEDTIKFIEEIEHVAQAPVSIINTKFPDRPDLRSMIDRRHWR